MDQFTNCTILVVDDKPDQVEAVKLIFEFHGARVLTATSGAECLALIHYKRPDVLLLDIQMPVMSGYDVLHNIRSDAEVQDLPVVALSVLAESNERERGLKLGFDQYIGKPYSIQDLLNTVAKMLNN